MNRRAGGFTRIFAASKNCDLTCRSLPLGFDLMVFGGSRFELKLFRVYCEIDLWKDFLCHHHFVGILNISFKLFQRFFLTENAGISFNRPTYQPSSCQYSRVEIRVMLQTYRIERPHAIAAPGRNCDRSCHSFDIHKIPFSCFQRGCASARRSLTVRQKIPIVSLSPSKKSSKNPTLFRAGG